MGTYNPDSKSTSDRLGELRGLESVAIIGVTSTLNLQVGSDWGMLVSLS